MLELTLLIANAEGSLVRLLGTIERRGFRIEGLRADPQAQGTRVRVTLAATARPVEVLVRQLQRLVDVHDVRLDIVRPAFALPAGAIVEAPRPAARSRRGLSFLGIPDRVSAAGGAV